MKYAANTTVAPERSRAEIERALTRYGATGFAYGWHEEFLYIRFEMGGRRVKFSVSMPSHQEMLLTQTGRKRSNSAVLEEANKAQRQRWRALALGIKAKLELVESGITVFEEPSYFDEWIRAAKNYCAYSCSTQKRHARQEMANRHREYATS